MKQIVLFGAIALLVVFGLGVGIYFSERPRRQEWITTASGLKYVDLKVGDGKEVKPGDTLVVHYTGWLESGRKFDSSHDGPDKPGRFLFNKVIPGWQEGLPGMRVGGKRRLVVPPELAYGSDGSPPAIPPNATLTFEVEIIDVM